MKELKYYQMSWTTLNTTGDGGLGGLDGNVESKYYRMSWTTPITSGGGGVGGLYGSVVHLREYVILCKSWFGLCPGTL